MELVYGEVVYSPVLLGVEIFRACEKDMDGPVRPLFLAAALKKYTAKKKSPRLLKLTNDVGRFVFVKE